MSVLKTSVVLGTLFVGIALPALAFTPNMGMDDTLFEVVQQKASPRVAETTNSPLIPTNTATEVASLNTTFDPAVVSAAAPRQSMVFQVKSAPFE